MACYCYYTSTRNKRGAPGRVIPEQQGGLRKRKVHRKVHGWTRDDEGMFDRTLWQSLAIFDVSFTKDPRLRSEVCARACVCVCVNVCRAQTGETRRPERNSNKKQSRIQLQDRAASSGSQFHRRVRSRARDYRLPNSPSNTVRHFGFRCRTHPTRRFSFLFLFHFVTFHFICTRINVPRIERRARDAIIRPEITLGERIDGFNRGLATKSQISERSAVNCRLCKRYSSFPRTELRNGSRMTRVVGPRFLYKISLSQYHRFVDRTGGGQAGRIFVE